MEKSIQFCAVMFAIWGVLFVSVGIVLCLVQLWMGLTLFGIGVGCLIAAMFMASVGKEEFLE
jgi:hypothetical protein